VAAMKEPRFGDSRQRIGIILLCITAAYLPACFSGGRSRRGWVEWRNDRPYIIGASGAPLKWIRAGWDEAGTAGTILRGVRQEEASDAVLDFRKLEQWLLSGVLLSTLLLAIALGQTFRIRKERIRTRRTEDTLRDTEQKLRLMANNLREMVLAYDMDRRLIFANPAVETLTGYAISELQAKGFINWIHPDDQARMTAYWDRLFEGASFEDEEYRLVTKDGQVKWATSTWGPLLDANGRQLGVQGCERDISERKLAENALRESERQFRGLLENVQLAAAMFDLSGRLTFCNDYLLAITGWSREEIAGAPVRRFLPEEEREGVERLIHKIGQTGGPTRWFHELAVLTKQGSRRTLQMNNVVLRDSRGGITGVASIGVDVTEHRTLQEQYLQAQKLESIGRLAGGVAHDFNNLLTVINGYSDLALGRLQPADPLYAQLAEIRKAGRRAADLTQQLLAFSRKQVIQPRALDLNQVVTDSERMLRRLVGEDIELCTRLSPQAGWVMADPGQLHQILMNLAVNARDAMPDGGRLTIRTCDESEAPPGSRPPDILGRCSVLVVSDTGAGMDEGTRQRVFEPFFTTKGTGHGTGLGLSTVYGIVQQSGGRIEVVSEPGKGATFYVFLPRVTNRGAGPAGEAESESAPGGGSETVLVVEDQHEVRRLTADVLRSHGYRVLEAADGARALAILEAHRSPLDLLLTDVVLPGINGRELATRAQQLRPDLKVLFTSGYTDDVIAHRGVLDPGVAYLPKPYAPEELASKVRETLAAS
jgi:two-component system cell cycle sensor histidine kinase/response regulator CckA